MFKKFLIIVILFVLLIAGLQLFGGRDFTQMELALDKYSMDKDLSSFLSDVSIIFQGDKIKESVFPNSRYAKQIMYRWKDEFGVLHVSERKPEVEKYEEIKLGDMQFQIEEGMTEEEIRAILQKAKE